MFEKTRMVSMVAARQRFEAGKVTRLHAAHTIAFKL